jgi:hypothetical protein
MRWFRSNVRSGARVAIVSLAIQLIVTFGHVHLYGLGFSPAKSAPIVSIDRSNAAMPGSTDPFRKGGSADYDCPICALIQLAGASAPSVAPALLVPALADGVRLDVRDEPQAAYSPHFSFQARGPPSV